jgi:hypothetical protein
MFRSALVVVMLVATQAWAQSPPTPVTNPAQLTAGSFEAVGEVDPFTVQLKEGKDYAFEVLTGSLAQVWTIRSPSGAVPGKVEPEDDESWGFEFRTGKAGTYTVEGRAAGESDYLPEDYQWRIVTDCWADAKTRCSIRPGQPQDMGSRTVSSATGSSLQACGPAGATR